MDTQVTAPGQRRLKLRAWRDAFALSQCDLASLAGLSRQTIVRLEAGGRAQPDTRRRLATVFGVSPNELYRDPPTRVPQPVRLVPSGTGAHADGPVRIPPNLRLAATLAPPSVASTGVPVDATSGSDEHPPRARGPKVEVREVVAQSILTEQKTGFLTSPPYPFTHTLAPYTGCEFGGTTCGLYCYARFLQSWSIRHHGVPWGTLVEAKVNAPELLDAALRAMRPERRRVLRVFCSSSTDPYQREERTRELTRRCLEVFARYPDLDLLVVQTRSPLAARDLDLLARLPYVWLSVTVETDDDALIRGFAGGPSPTSRLELVQRAAHAGINAQVAVSPCLPYTDGFASILASSGARRVIVDTFVDGDGTGGRRTAQSPYAQLLADWKDRDPALRLLQQLKEMDIPVGWSAAGFCGIAPRTIG